MLFNDGVSRLVRLADCLKVSFEVLEETTQQTTPLMESQGAAVLEAQKRAKKLLAGGSTADPIEALRTIPTDVAIQITKLQSRIHAQSLGIILLSCFTLEAYINAFAYYLLNERDHLGLHRDGKKGSAEVVYDAIERLSPREKWNDVRRLAAGSKFDASKRPWQDFKILFAFRDDHVHDKVAPYSADAARKRYGGNFPDSIGGLLDLGHAIYAAKTYWDMVTEIHEVSMLPASQFHRHYNLRPWSSDSFIEYAERLAKRYRQALQPGSGS
jgi:hypothetical protein